MESDAPAEPEPAPSPTRARRVLDGVEDLAAASAWRPSRPAVLLLSLLFAVAITAFARENFWLGFGVLAAMGALLLLARRHFFNPFIRHRPWQAVENQESLSRGQQWINGGFALWVPLTILIPASWTGLGLLVGVVAGVHAYFAVRGWNFPQRSREETVAPPGRAGLDPVLHPDHRLRICAALGTAGAVEGEGPDREMKYAVLRGLVGGSDATLSQQLDVLESHGYATRHREYGSRRAKDTVWIALTVRGNRELDAHVRALRKIAGQPDGS